MYQFEKWLRDLLAKLQKEKRWKSLNASYEESILEHSIKTAWLTQLMIAIELDAGNQYELDPYILLQCAINHDISESIVGDIAYTRKSEKDEENEKKAFEELITQIIPQNLHPYFPLPLDMSSTTDQKHKDFWEAIENIGYCMFALAEERHEFDIVITNHLPVIEKLSKFISVSMFYDKIKTEYQKRLDARH
ncbi:HD domain-containing protein [bacterium]|jgi:5'-deoxynucleotidase YfbR-like HD superfamily hydrolase|nr:HD domain-containing protein [Candidatus Komeilibacteria bacterium]MBT7553320.1 HD domain-containing protein [bacterium]